MKTHQSGSIKVLVEDDVEEQTRRGNRDDSDSDSYQREEIAEEMKNREKLIRESEETKKRFPHFIPSNPAWCIKPKKSWKYISPHSKRIFLQYARRAKR